MILRRLKRILTQLLPIQLVVGAVVDLEFRRWKRLAPGRTFAEFYAERVERKIHAGGHHKTLGARGWQPGHGPGLEFDTYSFAARGIEVWAQIAAFGIKPDMRCVDYGCGSLRIGQHAMRYLNAGNYWGLDVTEAFIAEGLKLIDPALIDGRKPRIDIISDEVLANVRLWQPDFIFANAVLVHVLPKELGSFFRRIDAMMSSGSKAVIIYVASDRTRRVKSMNWAFSEATLLKAARDASPTTTITFAEILSGPQVVDGRSRRALLLEAP